MTLGGSHIYYKSDHASCGKEQLFHSLEGTSLCSIIQSPIESICQSWPIFQHSSVNKLNYSLCQCHDLLVALVGPHEGCTAAAKLTRSQGP